jgi:hypothetical protein
VQSSDLNDHLRYLLGILFRRGSGEKVSRLRDMLRDGHIEADINCFWYGARGAPYPTIPNEIYAALDRLPARIQKDFHTA